MTRNIAFRWAWEVVKLASSGAPTVRKAALLAALDKVHVHSWARADAESIPDEMSVDDAILRLAGDHEDDGYRVTLGDLFRVDYCSNTAHWRLSDYAHRVLSVDDALKCISTTKSLRRLARAVYGSALETVKEACGGADMSLWFVMFYVR